MKKCILLGICLFISSLMFVTAQANPETPCKDWWNTVDLSGLCSISNVHFDVQGPITGKCSIDSNSSFPNDERIYVRIYYAYNQADAMEEYEAERESYEGMDGFSEVSDLGDAAYSFIQTKLSRLSSAVIDSVKSGYNIHIEVSGNYANNSNNCFDQSSVLDFARAVVNALE